MNGRRSRGDEEETFALCGRRLRSIVDRRLNTKILPARDAKKRESLSTSHSLLIPVPSGVPRRASAPAAPLDALVVVLHALGGCGVPVVVTGRAPSSAAAPSASSPAASSPAASSPASVPVVVPAPSGPPVVPVPASFGRAVIVVVLAVAAAAVVVAAVVPAAAEAFVA